MNDSIAAGPGQQGDVEHCAEGVRRFTVRLPMRGAVASLNVSVATGIVLYEALRQRSQRS